MERLRVLWERGWLKGLLLVVAVFFAWQPAWHAGFIWDDDTHLTANPCVVGPLGFSNIWTSSSASYYPLVLTSFWVQHAIWGLNPLPYHLVTIAMHAACAVLLGLVLRCLKVRGAWFGAALWALHPVQTESVAWITELKNTQSGLFYLLAIWFFLKWRAAGTFAGRQGTEGDYAFALLCAVLAILSKASTVMLPVVLGLIWWWNDGRWHWRNIFRLAPFFMISAAASGWTIWEQRIHSEAAGPDWSQSLPERLVIAGKDVWFYLGKLLWPHPLIFIYPRWEINAARPTAWLPVLALGAALFLLWLNRRGRAGPVFFAFAYFVVSLFPVLDFFNVYFFRYSFVGDHFQYLASIGPLALAAGMAGAFGSFAQRKPFLQPALGGTLLLGLGFLTWRQCGIYADNETLWRATIARNHTAWMAYYNLGTTLAQQGRTEEGIADLQMAVKIRPSDMDAHNNLGNALVEHGQMREAMVHFQKVLELQPNNVPARSNLAWVLATSPDASLRDGVKAVELAQEANRLTDGQNPIVVGILGAAYAETGRFPEAVAAARRALQLAEAQDNTGIVDTLRTQIELYQAGSPFRAPVPGDATGRSQQR